MRSRSCAKRTARRAWWRSRRRSSDPKEGTAIKRILCAALRLLPLLALLAVITLASEQTAKESNALSLRVSRRIVSLTTPKFEKLSRAKQNQLTRAFNSELRELAHGFLFMLLSMAALIALGMKPALRDAVARRVCLAYVLTMLAAVADETHQIFVDGRGAEALDLLVDWGGAGLGLLLGGSVAALLARRRRRASGAGPA